MHVLRFASSPSARAAKVLAVSSLLVIAACTPGTPPPAPAPALPVNPWPVVTREHVDLWLSGYAQLTRDTAHIPFFQRGYAARIAAAKKQRNVLTQLDVNKDQLAAGFVQNPNLVNGQFVPLYFPSWAELQQSLIFFQRAEGDPRQASDLTLQAYLAVLAGSFPSASDRNWVRLFSQSLDDERNRFYHDYWTAEQRSRDAVRVAVDSLWTKVYRPKLQRYLNNTQQASGELLLSLPLDGEGRTVAVSRTRNAVAVSFPETPGAAIEAVYVAVHELVNAVTNVAISDNTTPAEQRAGTVASYTANASVRAGALLLQRLAPELAPGYMRYYLREGNHTPPTGDPTSAFQLAFPIPDIIRDAIARQLDLVLGGI